MERPNSCGQSANLHPARQYIQWTTPVGTGHCKLLAIAFLIRNTEVPHVLETLYSPNGLAGAIRLQLPNSPRRTIACMYSKFSRQDKPEVDLFLQSLQPYDIIMGDYNDDIWSADPTRPWQQDLANSVFLDPLHASSQPPEHRQYYTRIPRHGRPRRLDARLIRQQIPNIPWTYYDTIQMPISDHALVLLGIRWRIGAPNPPRRKPRPSVSTWYTTHFQRFTNSMSALPVKVTNPPLHTARRILSAFAHTARPRQSTRTKTPSSATWFGNPRPHGTVTRGSTRAPHTETNRETPQSGSTQIGLLLQNDQEMVHRTHCARYAATPNSRDTTRPEPLCR